MQLFHPSLNSIARLMIFALPLSGAGTGVGLAVVYRSGYITGEREVIDQPVPFSHLHHVSQLGIDCRFCHTGVETSSFAGVPPTKTCMQCHQQMWVGSEMLNPIRESYRTNKPIKWERVNNAPDYVYFNHSIHIGKGVGCVSCHGQLDKMPLTFQSKSLLMEWCLDCHRAPEKHLRPLDKVTSMIWKPSDEGTNPDTGKPYTQKELGEKLKKEHNVRDPKVITSCSMCHR